MRFKEEGKEGYEGEGRKGAGVRKKEKGGC